MEDHAKMERGWYRSGYELWKKTIGLGDSDADLWDKLMGVVSMGGAPTIFQEIKDQNMQLRLMALDGSWITKWVDGGCRTIQTDDRYAAAMAGTKATKDVMGEIHIPWPAFLVRLPAGLFTVGDGNPDGSCRYVSHVRLMQLDARKYTVGCIDYFVNGNMRCVGSEAEADTLADALFDDRDLEEVETLEIENSSAMDMKKYLRSTMLAKKCIVGLLYTMQHTNNWRDKTSVSREFTRREGPPKHRNIIVGKPISINAVPAIRAACAHGSRAPAFQVLVRGHIKRQVIGVGRTGRKVIWVEPYWRGPEDAPILARPYKVGPNEKGAQP